MLRKVAATIAWMAIYDSARHRRMQKLPQRTRDHIVVDNGKGLFLESGPMGLMSVGKRRTEPPLLLGWAWGTESERSVCWGPEGSKASRIPEYKGAGSGRRQHDFL